VEAYHLKTDVYRGVMWYGFSGSAAQALVPVPVERVSEIQEMNARGKQPEELVAVMEAIKSERLEYTNGAGQESLTRFEGGQSNKKKKKRRRRPRPRS